MFSCHLIFYFQLELDNLVKERASLNELNSKLSRELQMLQSEHEHVEKMNDKLSKENKDKMNLISQLEQVSSSFLG